MIKSNCKLYSSVTEKILEIIQYKAVLECFNSKQPDLWCSLVATCP